MVMEEREGCGEKADGMRGSAHNRGVVESERGAGTGRGSGSGDRRPGAGTGCSEMVGLNATAAF